MRHLSFKLLAPNAILSNDVHAVCAYGLVLNNVLSEKRFLKMQMFVHNTILQTKLKWIW